MLRCYGYDGVISIDIHFIMSKWSVIFVCVVLDFLENTKMLRC
jgi:hypothetical protein